MLKNTLSLLLSKFYSKKESELVGHQAMPSTDNVALTPTTTSIDGWGAVCNGVAPTDGFACIRFTADTATCIASAQTPNVNVFTTPQVVGDILLCACPIAKGQVFTLCAREAKNIECWFTKTIGGGYHTLKRFVIQGDGLCLSLSFNCSQKPSLKVKNRGLAYRECRQLLRQSYPQQWTQHGELMLLQKTAMWFFKAEHLSSSCITHLVQALIMGESRVSLEDLYRFGKAALCTITSKVRTADQDSPLLHVSLSKLEKGGSLC